MFSEFGVAQHLNRGFAIRCQFLALKSRTAASDWPLNRGRNAWFPTLGGAAPKPNTLGA